ncbi:hypothetical protein BJV78DRAFT_1211769 [Lactifluus subvellereus]|nr:hypothetical protein BJV78DRAFT_1211769 [Lactifluus subvellereus]
MRLTRAAYRALLQQQQGDHGDTDRPLSLKLPEEVLLEIFDSYRQGLECQGNYENLWNGRNGWFNLAHVCRNWRRVVLASPSRLRLRLIFTAHTPTRKIVWARLPQASTPMRNNQYPTKDVCLHPALAAMTDNKTLDDDLAKRSDDNEQAWFDQVNTDGYEKLILCSAEPFSKTIGGQVVNMRSYKLKEAAQLACAWCTGRWSSPARSGPGVREDLRTLDDE